MKITIGYSKNILAHGLCKIVSTRGKHLIQVMRLIVRPDGTTYYLYDAIALVNKDEVSNIKTEEV